MSCLENREMVVVKKKNKTIQDKADLRAWIVLAVYIVFLIAGVVGLSFTKLYESLSDKTSLAILWTMVGFSFTVFCFLYPRMTKSIKISDAF